MDEPHCSADTPPKKRPRSQYKTKWQQNWASKYPSITKKSETLAECSVCFRAFNFDHQGERDILRHLGGADHIKRAKELEKISKIDEMFKQKAGYYGKQVIKAEVLFTGFLVEHNIPLAVSDHAGPLFRKMFPDSAIAKKYSCARTKTTAVLNGAMAPEMILSLVETMKYAALKSYFESEEECEHDRLCRLKKRFADPMIEVYLLFNQAILPVFTSANVMFQRTAPMIHLGDDIRGSGYIMLVVSITLKQATNQSLKRNGLLKDNIGRALNMLIQ
eukprot:Em0012g606a